jgi:ubiquinone/menaquinone biosynthesis C-methylase UbiE
MSRPGQIDFLSRTARLYDPLVCAMRFPSLWDAVAEQVNPRPGERCLDVCTGTGGVALALARRGAHAVGLDLAPGLLARARRKARGEEVSGCARFLRGDARALAFPEASFPVVTCSMALHEMAEAERHAVLGELRRVVQGRVLVADYRVPRSRLAGALFRMSHLFEYLESDDFESFARGDLDERLQDAGLRVDERIDHGPYAIWCCRPAPELGP